MGRVIIGSELVRPLHWKKPLWGKPPEGSNWLLFANGTPQCSASQYPKTIESETVNPKHTLEANLTPPAAESPNAPDLRIPKLRLSSHPPKPQNPRLTLKPTHPKHPKP